ncbi:SET domain-containing protein [Backusella circina FSU 941]|nr:SET domain-containing protein [Backusella circina FSU 941]
MEKYLEHHNLTVVDSGDAIKGRSVHASTKMERGTIIVTSQPLGTVTLPSSTTECCNYCFRKQPNLQRCSRCKKSYFCDMGCFQNAWLSYHQYVCTSSTATPPTSPPKGTNDTADTMDLEMLERVALNVGRHNKRMEKQQGKGDPESGNEETVNVTMDAFFSLMGHTQPPRVQQKFESIAAEALKKEYIQQTGLTSKELVHYLTVFKSNNFSIDDKEMFAIGEGTYPIASLFNHSCRPNAVVMFDGALAEIHAIENIESGTEITISYVDAAHALQERQSTLNEKYFFKCKCKRCTGSYLTMIDTLLGEEEGVTWSSRAQQLLSSEKKDDQRTRLLKEVEEWDLLEMCRLYDRNNDSYPDKTSPLTIANYTHYFIQLFAPYLVTCENHALHTATSSQANALSSFDDPLPSLARPAVQPTYDLILETAMKEMLEYPTDPENVIIPSRLSTLSPCPRLFYDEMGDGHWRNAVKLGMYVLIQYCLIYPPYHPMLAQHFLILAKACWNSIIQSELLNDGQRLEKVYERGVRRWILLSKETIAVSFGKHSSLWRETLELEWLFLREQKLK